MENFVIWFELPVTDMERAKKFYSYVFQLDIEVQDIGDRPYGFSRCAVKAIAVPW